MTLDEELRKVFNNEHEVSIPVYRQDTDSIEDYKITWSSKGEDFYEFVADDSTGQRVASVVVTAPALATISCVEALIFDKVASALDTVGKTRNSQVVIT